MQRRIYINGTSFGWSERVMAGFLGVLFLILGFTFGAVILSLGAIAGLVLAARLWWLRRQLQRHQPGARAQAQAESQTQTRNRVIEGEYRVLNRHQRETSW